MAKNNDVTAKLVYMERNAHRELRDEHRWLINTLIGQPQEAGLPPVIENEYWRWKEMSDRSSMQLNPLMLMTIVALSGHELNAPPGQSVIQAFRAGIIKRMNHIEVLFRDEWKPAQIVDVNERDRTVRVCIVGDGAARSVPVAHCRLKDYDRRKVEPEDAAEHAASNV